MKKLLIILLLSTSCSIQNKYGYSIKKENNQAGGLITYKDYDYSFAQEKKSCENEMLDSAQTNIRLKSIPRNGWLIIQTGGFTLDEAKTDYHLYIIKDSLGFEVLRVNGTKGSIPDYSINRQTHITTWSCFDAVPLNIEIKPPFTVYLVNKFSNKQSVFLITKL